MEPLKESLSRFLEKLMKRGHFTQRALAELLGISQGHLSAYLSQKELPRIDVIIKLAEIGGVTVDDVVKGTKEPQIPEGYYAAINIRGTVKDSPVTVAQAGARVDININRKVTQRHEYQPKAGDVTAEQARILKDLVEKVVETEKVAKRRPSSYGAVWNALNRRMGVTYYREIKEAQFLEAQAYLQQWLGRLKRGRWVDPDEWRKEMYKAIFAKAKSVGYTKAQVDDLIFERHGKGSIRDLKEKELRHVYNWAMSLGR